MPLTVFPAPGCFASKQFLSPFSSFDIGPYSGGTFKNLLLYSENQGNSVWVKGSGITVVPEYDGTAVITYNTATKSNSLSWYNEYSVNSDLLIMPVTAPVSALGQTVTVTPNTTYTFSFHAKTGTATTANYGVYDNTNNSIIVTPTEYTSQLNAKTFTRMYTSFTTGANCTSVTVYPFWTGSSTGTITIFGTQLELGNYATVYQSTQALSFAAKGYTPQIIPKYAVASSIKDSFVLKAAPAIPVTSQLQKKFEVIKSVAPLVSPAKLTRNATLRTLPTQLTVAKVSSRAVIRGDSNLSFDADIVKKFKVTNIASQLFFAPSSSILQKQLEIIRGEKTTFIPNKLSIASRLKSDTNTFQVNRLRSGAVLRSDRTPTLDVDTVKQYKISYNTTEAFFAPAFNRLEVFQNTPNQSDFKFTVTAQTPDTYTSYLYPDLGSDTGMIDLNSGGAGLTDLTSNAAPSLIDWYLEYSPTSETLMSVTTMISRYATKTYSYAPQNLLVNQQGGTLTTIPDTTAGSIQFNGTSDYLSMPYAPMILSTTTTPLTAECWVNMDLAVPSVIMSEEWTGGGNISMTMGIGSAPDAAGSNVWFGWYDGATWIYAVSSQQLVATKWYHIAGVFTGTQIQIYINGQLDGTANNSWGSDAAATTLFIGRRWDTAVSTAQVYFPGYISNVRLVKGYALYTGSFTPSTTVLSVVPGTQVLLPTRINKTGFTDTSTNALLVTRFGNPKLMVSNPGFTTQTIVYTQVSNPSGVYNPFDVGSSVKITDVKENVFYYAQVLASTNNTVTIAQPDWFIPTSGITLEAGATVYSKDAVDPVSAPTSPRENLYYFNLIPQLRADKSRNPSLALVQTQSFELPSANTLTKQLEIIKGDRLVLTPNQLQKQIETMRGDTANLSSNKFKMSLAVRGETTKVRAEKLSVAAVLRGDKNLPFDADVLSKFKIAPNTTEVFYSPSSSSLQKQIAILRNDTILFDVDKVNIAAVLRSDRNLTFDADVLSKFKIATNTTVVFDAPLTSNIPKQIETVRGENTTFKTHKVSASLIVRGDTSILSASKMNVASVLRGDKIATLDADILSKFTISANTTEVFYTPFVDKLQSGFVVRDAKTAYIPSLAGAIIKNRVPAMFTQVLYTPSSSNLQKQLFTLRSDATTLKLDKLASTTVIRSDSALLTSALNFTNFISQVGYSTKLPPVNAADRFYYFNLAPSKFADRYEEATSFTSLSQIFESPLSSALVKPIEVIRSDRSKLAVSSLKDSFVVRSDSALIAANNLQKPIERVFGDNNVAFDIDSIKKFFVASNSTQVFATPIPSQLLKQVEAIKGDSTKVDTAKLSVVQVIRGEAAKIQTSAVKSGFVARGDRIKFGVDNVRNQKFLSSTVSLFDSPKNDKLSASIVVRPDRVVIASNTLSQFEIGEQPGDFKFAVSGQSNINNVTSTTLDWYLDYTTTSDILSTVPNTNDMNSVTGAEDLLTGSGFLDLTPDPVTYYFTPQTFIPFDVGSTVKISNINGPFTFFAKVTAATRNSVSFVQPSWYINTSGTYVESGSTVYPTNYVDPKGPATNARESFYYFNLAPSIRADRYQSSNVFAQPTQTHQLDPVVYQLPRQFEVIRDSFTTSYTADNFDNYRDQTTPVLANPTSPIENLYYFNLTPGLRADHWQRKTALNSQIQVFETPKVLKLSAARVLRESVRSSYLNYSFSIKQLKTPATAQEVFFVQENRGVVTIQNLIKGLDINKPQINHLDKLKLNSGSVEVFYNPDSGFVIRMKTGDSKLGQRGIQDPAAQRKEPIQFWN